MPELIHLNDHTTFTQRVVMSLVEELQDLHEAVHRVTVQIEALAKEHGIKVTTAEDDEI